MLPDLVAGLVAAVAVRNWFVGGRFVAAGDIAPFFRDGLASEIDTAWGYGLTGAGSPTAEVARLPEYLVYRVVTGLGGSAVSAQAVFYWLVLTFAATGAIAACRTVVARRPVLAAVGILAIANPLFAVNLPNPLVPVALGTLGFGLAAVVAYARGRATLARVVVVTLPLGYLSINPPTLAVVTAVLVVAAVAVLVAARGPLGFGIPPGVLGQFSWGLPLGVAAHLWWLVPTLFLYTTGTRTSAVTDPEAWSWTQVNNSVPNVVTMTAHWGWGLHEYLPFSDGLDAYPGSAARWILPVLAFTAPVLAIGRTRRRAGVVAVVVAVGMILIGKGLHQPLAIVNRALYAVPGMWLLREPMSKIGPVLLLAYLVGAAVALDGLAQRISYLHGYGRDRRPALVAVIALVALSASFGLPVVRGDVVPTERSPLPSSRVEVPDGWLALAADLNADPQEGKALVLPSLPFYQATTDWGFHGAATLPRDLLDRPAVFDLPGGYFTDAPAVSELVGVVASARADAVLARALDALGVSHVIVRRDFSDAQAVARIADVSGLVDRLAGSDVFDSVAEYGVATVFSLDTAEPAVSVYPGTVPIDADTPSPGLLAAGAGPGIALVDDPAEGGAAASVVDLGQGSTTVDVISGGSTREVRVAFPVTRSLRVDRDPDGITLGDGLALRLDGVPVATAGRAHLPMTDPVPYVSVDGQLVPIDDGDWLDVSVGATVAAVGRGWSRSIGRWSDVGDCSRLDDREPALFGHVRTGRVELTADGHAACVDAPASVAGGALLETTVTVESGVARLCVWSDDDDACIWEHRIFADDDGPVVAEVRAAVDSVGDTRLFLAAEAEHPDRPESAEVVFDDVRLTDLRIGAAASVQATLTSDPLELAAGAHRIEVARDHTERRRVGAPSAVQNCNNVTGDADLTADVTAGTIRLEASADAACVSMPVEGLHPDSTYRVGFEYRTNGGPARWCLWVPDLAQCAGSDLTLPPAREWTTVDVALRMPMEIEGAELYVYADAATGLGDGTAVTEYRSVRIAPDVPLVVELRPVTTGQVSVTSRSGPGGAVDATVTADGTGFVLAMADTHHGGWQLLDLPAGATARPVVVDGYRQGWVIDGLDGTAVLRIRFAPSRWARSGFWVSWTALALTGFVLSGRALRRRLGAAHRTVPDPEW